MAKMKTGTMILIAVVILGAIYFIQGGTILGFAEPELCEITPYSEECYCNPGQNKRETVSFVKQIYYCENNELFLDPAAADWQVKLTDYASATLNEQYPGCTQTLCDQGVSKWELSHGASIAHDIFEDPVRRKLKADCFERTDQANRIFASVTVDAQTGAFEHAFCADWSANPTGPDEPATSGNSWFYGSAAFGGRPGKDGSYLHGTQVIASCGDIDNGIATWTARIRSSYSGHVTEWIAEDPNIEGVTCEIVSDNGDTATVKCDTSCPHERLSFISYARAMIDDEVLNSWCESGVQTLDFIKPDHYWCNNKNMYQCLPPIDARVVKDPASSQSARQPLEGVACPNSWWAIASSGSPTLPS